MLGSLFLWAEALMVRVNKLWQDCSQIFSTLGLTVLKLVL